MKNHIWLAVLASFTMALAGCSRHAQAIAYPKINNLGVIKASDGKPSRHTLADGRVCTITPIVLPDGNVRLTTTITTTNVSGVERKSLAFEAPISGRTCAFEFDRDTVLAVTLNE